MKMKFNKKIRLITGVTALGGAVIVAAYLTNTPPFKESAVIKSSEVCDSLGGGDKITAALQETLPDASKYEFQDSDQVRADPQDNDFLSSCFIRADGKTALATVTEMVRWNPPKLWSNRTVSNNSDIGAREFDSFNAGEKSISSYRFAAIYVPCVPDGILIGGTYNLSVEVRATQHSSASKSVTKRSLAEIALSAARRAHKQAQCDLPSKLPAETIKFSPSS
ncbi:hypothetical protein ACIOEX_03655 [Streptomyces sp. NPDC087850]|uniref:hypothetical protein n=1 Tax=Streptomyces sp. NPDC087850 TaxID=3365809 RepID=UPI0038122F38